MKDLVGYFMDDPGRARLIYFFVIVVCPMVVLAAYILVVRRAKAEQDPLEEDSWEGESAGWLSCAVADKGGVSVYGLQSRPVTLYANQWMRLANFIPTVVRFIAENHSKVVWRNNEKPGNLNEIVERFGK